MKGMIQSIVSS